MNLGIARPVSVPALSKPQVSPCWATPPPQMLGQRGLWVLRALPLGAGLRGRCEWPHRRHTSGSLCLRSPGSRRGSGEVRWWQVFLKAVLRISL